MTLSIILKMFTQYNYTQHLNKNATLNIMALCLTKQKCDFQLNGTQHSNKNFDDQHYDTQHNNNNSDAQHNNTQRSNNNASLSITFKRM
jgi:hypothetical protein